MNNTNRFAHIDALRGIAALLVIWLHVSEVFIHSTPEILAQGTALYDIARVVDFAKRKQSVAVVRSCGVWQHSGD